MSTSCCRAVFSVTGQTRGKTVLHTNPNARGQWLAAAIMILACCAGIAGGARAQTQPLERVVAIVDDDIILASEYQDRLQQVRDNVAKQGVEAPPPEVLARQVLDRLILERIQLQMGERAGVRISDAQLNEALSGMASQNGMGLDQFRASVEAQGGSYNALREQVRQEMIISRVQQGNVRSRVQVTEQEVNDYLSSEEGQKRTSAVYHIGHLLLPLAKEATLEQENEARAYIETLRTRLAGDETFERFMKAPDKSRYALSGGDLGWRLAGDLPGIFLETVPALKVGEISEPVRSASGLHLVKLFEKRGGSGQMTQQTLVRHILIKPSEIRSDEQAQLLATKLHDRIVAGEDFAKLAREFSDDIGSAQEGGSLGWTSAGQMVPAFEQVMNQTGAGEVSAPFKSEFGWHVLKVEERRTEDLSEELRRNQARNILFGQKYDDELNTWLQKIRDEAFVEIKI
ncbi:MAG: peptidylprolyl isomerase [Gammaproteobacteria bacterium]|nr:peptidylprolyl isomerase [Gammaproteobacteria bacterium]